MEVWVNVYDLLPVRIMCCLFKGKKILMCPQPGKFSNILWKLGGAVLHSGVVLGNREYAFGAHGQSGLSGVYWTTPKTEPPGGIFRYGFFHGIAKQPQDEIDVILHEVRLTQIQVTNQPF